MKKALVLLLTGMLTISTFTACGSSSSESTSSSESSSESTESSEESSTDESSAKSSTEEESSEVSEAESSVTEAPLPDGTYDVDFNTDSSMFHTNDEYNNGKSTLTVKDGKMTVHITLLSQNIVNLYLGTAEDAQKEGAELIEPTTTTIEYTDGSEDEVVNCFDIPVEALDTDFNCALLGKKGVWYDHIVSVSSPEE